MSVGGEVDLKTIISSAAFFEIANVEQPMRYLVVISRAA